MSRIPRHSRRGAMLIKIAILLVPMIGVLALAIDYGILLKERTDLQRAADAAVLAAVRDLVPDSNSDQDFAAVRSRVREYVNYNIHNIDDFQIADSDIQIGRYDPETIYSEVNILDSGIADTVRVTLRRDESLNNRVSLVFARVLGLNDAGVSATATAVLQKSNVLNVGDGILPFAIPQSAWNARGFGDQLEIYSGGQIHDASGNQISGNWGTVDIGAESNSTSDLSVQILYGLRQQDLNALKSAWRIPNDEYIDTTVSMSVQGDTGLSAGIQAAVTQVHGQTRYVPIYDTVSGHGNNSEFQIVGWGSVKVIGSNWDGAQNTYVEIEKQISYNPKLMPQSTLSNPDDGIEGVFSTAVLVE